MRKMLALAAAATSVFTGFSSAPTIASAQEWRDDPCRSERHDAGRTGTIAGGVIGALIGGGAGAVAGHQIGAHSVHCNAYPSGYRYHRGCRWVTDSYRGRDRSYEVCRDRDGYWRRYG